jgi:pilus assembly protein CpaB
MWEAWPGGDLPSTYAIEGKRPLADFVGALARVAIGAGEPVTESKLVLANARGFMAAVLQPGMRAVSVSITATSAVSGFIYAGDRVDVLLTLVLNSAQGQHNATETILRGARVIAMDQKVDFSPGDKPESGAKTATLELTPKQTEIVTLAAKMGDLSLVLRSLQDNADENGEAAVTENAPALPGDSYTRDAQVSRLLAETPVAAPPAEPARTVVVLRGSAASRQQTNGSSATSGDLDGGRPADAKPAPVVFTRTPSPDVPQ